MNSVSLASTVGLRSGGPYQRTPSLIVFLSWPLDQNRAASASSSSSRPPDASLASAPWPWKSWVSSVLSLPRPRQRVRALNAGQCTAPVCPLFTCSRPSQSSHGRKGPEALPPVALCRPGYLSSGQPFLVFLCTPPSLSNHPQLSFELLSPCHRLPPWPHLGTSVKAVPQSSSLSGFCSLSSLLLRWN